MRTRKLAIAALIAAVPTATAFAQSALDQSVPRMSPTTEPRVSPTTSPTDPTTTSQNRNTRGIPERAPVAAPRAMRPDAVRDPSALNPGDARAIGAPPPTR